MPVATKKTVRKVSPRATDPERAEPLVRLKRSSAAAVPAEQVLLFTKEYDDDDTPDVEFWVPKRRMARLSLTYMRKVRHEGDNSATAWLLEEVLGTEAYEDLMDDEQLEDDELAQIFAIVTNAVMGAKDPKGSSR
jgi:hypothetical protein